eukprot:NODE_752_length_4544_cov_0.307312.p2 type:complete len:274 gc:universal NODE_752_length_4544_cov_0.307312:4076-3255(-)
MLVYHPFYFAFAYGLGFVVSIACLIIDTGSIWLFGQTKMQKYMIVMDSALLVTASIAGYVPKSTGFWIAIAIFKTFFVMCFTLYSFLRCYSMTSIFIRKLSVFGYGFILISFLFFEFSCYGFVPNKWGAFAFIATLPFATIIANYLSYGIIKLIKKNPLHSSSGKQTRLVWIAYTTILVQNVVAIPSVILVILGDYYENGMLLGFAYCTIPLISFGYTISNFLMTTNRCIEDQTVLTGVEIMTVSWNSSAAPPRRPSVPVNYTPPRRSSAVPI